LSRGLELASLGTDRRPIPQPSHQHHTRVVDQRVAAEPLRILFDAFDELPEASRCMLTETITVEPGGVTVEDELRGSGVDAMRVTYPMLVFDGLRSTRVDVSGNSIRLEMDGRTVGCTILEPSDAVWVRSAKTVGHRNGLVEEATAEIQGVRAVYRIGKAD
jgi:hypothetical protein